MGWFFLAAIVFDVLNYTFSIASNSLAEAKKFGPAIALTVLGFLCRLCGAICYAGFAVLLLQSLGWLQQ